jgi:hypothetical protein
VRFGYDDLIVAAITQSNRYDFLMGAKVAGEKLPILVSRNKVVRALASKLTIKIFHAGKNSST